jgi:O-antigen/teichoic acid export membrane protein
LPRLGPLIGLTSALSILPLLALSLPLQLLAAPAAARLDRDLKFGRASVVDVLTQVSYYLLAIPLAVGGWGAWSLAIGWVFQQTAACVLYHFAAHWWPRPAWDRAALKKMLNYALSYSISGWIWQGRSLVNPIIVGGILGVEAVGFVNLAIRLVDLLSFVKDVVWRVAIATFARFRADNGKLATAIAEGMEFQIFAVGLPLLLFAVLGKQIINVFFGSSWMRAFDVYPFIALAALTNCIFSLHLSALYVFNRNWDVTNFAAAYLFVFSIGAYFFCGTFGPLGYGFAETAALVSYVVIHLRVRRVVGAIPYGFVLPCYGTLALALLLRPFSAWSCALPLGLLAWPETWRRLRSYVRVLIGSSLPNDVPARE